MFKLDEILFQPFILFLACQLLVRIKFHANFFGNWSISTLGYPEIQLHVSTYYNYMYIYSLQTN